MLGDNVGIVRAWPTDNVMAAGLMINDYWIWSKLTIKAGAVPAPGELGGW